MLHKIFSRRRFDFLLLFFFVVVVVVLLFVCFFVVVFSYFSQIAGNSLHDLSKPIL